MCYRCDRFKDVTGYKGQKYQVVATDANGKRKPLGWQNSEDIADAWKSLAGAWRLTDLRLEEVKHEAER